MALEKLATFQTFNNPQLNRMRDETARFITAYQRGHDPRWLSLLGTSGAGKTMLGRNVQRICRGVFVPWIRVCKMLREGEYRWFEDLCEEPLVVLDDIGSEYQTGFIAAKLYEFLSSRTGDIEKPSKWTVVTANLSLKQLSEMDARIASRMIRGYSVVVDVNVPDFNLRK